MITINDSNATPFDRILVEDQLLNFTEITLSDDPTAIVTVTLTVSNGILTLGSTAGLITVNGDITPTVTFSGSLADVNNALNNLEYNSDDDYNGAETLDISVISIVGVNPPTSDNQSVAIAITAVNDDPELIPTANLSVDEGQSNVAFSDPQFGLNDPDITTGQQVISQQIVSIQTVPTRGTLRLNGNILVVGSVFSYDQLANVTYTHDGSDVSPLDQDFFDVQVNDGGGGLSNIATITIDLNPINQQPTITPPSLGAFEGSINNTIAPTIDLGGDNFDTLANADVTIDAVNNQGQGTLYFDADNSGNFNPGEELFVGQTFKADQVNRIRFDSNGAEPTLPEPFYTITVTDSGGGAGTPLSATTIIPVSIIPVDDDPTIGVNNTLTVTGASTTVLNQNTDLRVNDVDSDLDNLVYSLDTRPSKGVLQVFDGTNWQNLGIGGLFTQQQINDGHIRYVHQVTDANPTDTDSFSFVVRDSALRTTFPIPDEEGGVRSTPLPSASPRPLDIITFNININNPSLATQTTPDGASPGYGGDTGTRVSNSPQLDATVIFTNDNSPNVPDEGGSNIISNDPSDPLNSNGINMLFHRFVNSGIIIPAAQTVYTLTSLPSNGTLINTNTGKQLIGDSTFTQEDIDNGFIRFDHDGGEDFINSFDYSVSVGGEVRINDTFSIDVTPINDNPTIGQGSPIQLPEADVTTNITTTQLIISDVDGVGSDKSTGFAAINTLQFQVINSLPNHGTLFVDNNLDGIIDSGEAIMLNSFISKQDLIDGKIKYQHNGTENFLDTFTVQALDNYGALSAPANINIDIFPVNDPPSIALTPDLADPVITDPLFGETGVSKNDRLTVDEGGTDTITNTLLQAVDPDNNIVQRQYRLTELVSNGELLLDGSPVAIGGTFTQKDIDDGKLSYTHDGTETTSDLFKFTISDGSSTFPVPPQSAQFEIIINPANDPADLTTANTNFDISNTSPLPITGISVSDDEDLAVVVPGETDIIRVILDPQLTQNNGTPSPIAGSF